jgi:hypothetical protein
MNIDDLKEVWSNDEPKDMHLPVSTQMFGKTTSAVQRLRKNMKAEFIATLISYAVILIFMFGRPQITFLFNVTAILLFTLFILNCYYFSRFYIFYKSISRYDFSLRSSIRKIAYELELNTEIYKTYNFSVAPLAVLITIALICGPKTSGYLEHTLASGAVISLSNMLIIFSVILISFIITYVCFNWHIRLQFGKYLAELKQVMGDLDDEVQ